MSYTQKTSVKSILLFGSETKIITSNCICDKGQFDACFLVSVSRAQTAGRGWTQRSQSSLLALHCLISLRGSLTASVSAAATLPASVNPLTRLRPPQSATSLVRKCAKICRCITKSSNVPVSVNYPKNVNVLVRRYPICPGKGCSH